jgi:hypothetical protein
MVAMTRQHSGQGRWQGLTTEFRDDGGAMRQRRTLAKSVNARSKFGYYS